MCLLHSGPSHCPERGGCLFYVVFVGHFFVFFMFLGCLGFLEFLCFARVFLVFVVFKVVFDDIADHGVFHYITGEDVLDDVANEIVLSSH